MAMIVLRLTLHTLVCGLLLRPGEPLHDRISSLVSSICMCRHQVGVLMMSRAACGCDVRIADLGVAAQWLNGEWESMPSFSL